jgi:tricorn protease
VVTASRGAYLRFPSVQGNLLTFVADDDVWLAPLAGGAASRLIADRVPVSSPRLSPDAEAVAWTSDRYGSPEVFVTEVTSGESRRLTHWGAARTATRGWTSTGDVLVVSDAGQPASARTWAHALPVDGSPGHRLDYGIVDDVAHGPDGQVVTATSAGYVRDPARWKRYRGGTAAKLWIDRDGSGEFSRLLPGHRSSLVHPMWVGDRLLVVSDHEGTGRLYVLDDDAPSGLRELARHDDFYVRHAATDGATIVYVAGGQMWALDAVAALAEGAEPRPIDVHLRGARQGRQTRTESLGKHRGAVAVDRTGRASAVEGRGTVHWLPHRDGPPRALLAEPGVRARVPMTVGDDRVAYVSDAEGEDAVELVGVGAGDSAPRRLGAGQLGRVLEGVAAPDGRTLALASHDGRLLLVDVTEDGDGAVREVARAREGEVTGLAWSPDSAWLAWSHPGPEPLRQLCTARVAGDGDAEVIEATPLRFTDTEPVFTTDGKHLAFLSVRSLDPVYDAYVFDLSFPGGCRPCLLPLSARTPSPFDPEVGGRPVQPAAGAATTARAIRTRCRRSSRRGASRPPRWTSPDCISGSCRSRSPPPATAICGPSPGAWSGCGSRPQASSAATCPRRTRTSSALRSSASTSRPDAARHWWTRSTTRGSAAMVPGCWSPTGRPCGCCPPTGVSPTGPRASATASRWTCPGCGCTSTRCASGTRCSTRPAG